MPAERGSGDIPEKPAKHLENNKRSKSDRKRFNPYQISKDLTNDKNIQNQNHDKKDAHDPRKWTGQLNGLFDMLGKQLTPEVTKKLNDSTDARNGINETDLQASNRRQANETQRRQFDGQCRLFEDHKRYMQMNNITEVY